MKHLDLLNSVMEFLNRVPHWVLIPGQPDLHALKLMVREARVQEAEELTKHYETAPPAAPAPAVPDLKHKPTVQRLMDLARKFRATPGDLYDGAYKELQQACYEALSAAPAVREPQDERIRWRDAVIKEAESALRTAEKEFADMPTWANAGHAAKKVTHALAVIAALGIGGGGNG